MTSMPTLTDRAHEHRVPRAEFEAFRDEREQRPDGARYELLDGEIVVTPAPSTPHQLVIAELTFQLKLQLPPALRVLSAPYDVALGAVGDGDTILQPDLLIARREDLTAANLPVPPVLVVEVLSPSTWRRDLGSKRDLHAAAGVQHYWVIAPDTPSITVYRLGDDGAYREETHLTGDEHWSTSTPVDVTLCPTDLIR